MQLNFIMINLPRNLEYFDIFVGITNITYDSYILNDIYISFKVLILSLRRKGGALRSPHVNQLAFC